MSRRSLLGGRLLAAVAAVAAIVVAVVVAAGLTVAASPPRNPAPTKSVGTYGGGSPAAGGEHVSFRVAFTGARATGLFGRTRRSYIVNSHAVRPASACVNNRAAVLSGWPAGTRMRATLKLAGAEGGPSGWCRGTFDGTVTYSEAYACPARGVCRPPKAFPRRTRIVARFSFRVR